MTGVSVSPDWALFRDWCAAAERPCLPTTAAVIAEFMAEVPAAASTQRKRVQAIARAHTAAGLPLALPVPAVQSPWRVGRGWLDVSEALRRVPMDGWPMGLAGCRDAYLMVLIGQRGLSREAARAVGVADIRQDREGTWSILGEDLPRPPEAEGCPSCAVARWMEVLDRWDGWGKWAARDYLVEARSAEEHLCLEASTHAGLLLNTLLPGIDRYGWLADWSPISARSISAILAYRQDAAQWPEVYQRVPSRRRDEPKGDYQRESMQDLADLLDDVDGRAAAALKATAAVVEEMNSMVERTR